MTPRYSICITNYNDAKTIRKSMLSIIGQIDERFEVVIVDSMSTDGSYEILKEFEEKRQIKLIRQRSSRGEGRNIAFKNSSGDYVLACIDLDDIILPRLAELLELYHRFSEGFLLRISTVQIAPRSLIQSLGGWRDLQGSEDWEIAARAAREGKYRWSQFRIFASIEGHEERKTATGTFRHRFERYTCRYQCGRTLFHGEGKVNRVQRLIAMLAWVNAKFRSSYSHPFNHTFDYRGPDYFVSLGGV